MIERIYRYNRNDRYNHALVSKFFFNSRTFISRGDFMVLRNISERRWSHAFVRSARMICVFFLLTAFCGEGNTGYAQQFNLLKGNNPAPTPSRSAVSSSPTTQNRGTAQQKRNTLNENPD